MEKGPEVTEDPTRKSYWMIVHRCEEKTAHAYAVLSRADGLVFKRSTGWQDPLSVKDQDNSHLT